MEMAVANVEVISNTVKKPCPPIPSSSPPPYLDKRVPLTILDLVSPNTPIPMILAFRPPVPDNQAMVDALLKTLFHYPHLVGSFGSGYDDRPCIVLDDTGVRVIETQVPTTLEENLPLEPSTKFYFNLMPLMGGTELIQIQFNRFACGGMILGLTIHHWVADATSYSAFLKAWSKILNGFDLDPLPYHERSLAVTTRDPPSSDFDEEFERKKKPFSDCTLIKDVAGPLPPAPNLSVQYSKNFLSKLKAKANEGIDDLKDQSSTYQSLLAHVWKKVTFVRGLEEDVTSNYQFSVNGRRRVSPPVPDNYFGNFILGGTATMKVGDLLRASYQVVGRVIRKAIAEIDHAYFKSFVEYGLTIKADDVKSEMVGPMHTLGPNLFNTSWLNLGFDELAFGTGGLCSFLVPGMPIDGFTLFLPSYEDGGGINVLIAFKDKESADLFRQVSHSLE